MHTLKSLSVARVGVRSRVNLDDWEARDDLLDSIPSPVYRDHEWLCSLPDDPYPDGRGVRMEQVDAERSRRKKSLHETVLDFRTLALTKPRACLLLGVPNEIEYSANVIFEGDRLRLPEANPERRVYSGWREYYTIEATLFHDNLRVVHNGPVLCERLSTRAVLRVDRRPDATDDFVALSAKLKLYQRNAYVAGRYKIALTGSLEVPYDPSRVVLPLRADESTKSRWLPRGNKSLLLLYWGVAFTLDDDGRQALLRVAFRQPAAMREDGEGTVPRRVPGSDTKCNIECESNVSGELFVRLLRIIYLYYRHQFERYDGLVLPYRADCTPDSIDGLNEEERALARTYAHVPWGVCHAEEETTTNEPSDDVAAFVRWLGLAAYANYDASGEIECRDPAVEALLADSAIETETTTPEAETDGDSGNDGSTGVCEADDVEYFAM